MQRVIKSRREYLPSFAKMLRLCVGFFLLGYVAANSVETWPFTLADKYMEEFKSKVDELRAAANANYLRKQHETQLLKIDESSWSEAIEDDVHYDFIIIGGGTSGSVLASRLSEIPEWKILLLEAGSSETKATRVPKNWEVLRNTHLNWGFRTTPQNYSCLAMYNHECTIPAGRALGGTSAINSMIYTRGNHRDYDIWADLENKGWCWDDVLPIFKEIEDSNFEPFDKKFHHRGGLQHLQHAQYLTDLSDHILRAAKELDIHIVDYNGKYQTGAGVPQLTTECGQRYSTANSYLERGAKRDNLIVRPLSQALKILISTHTKDAKSVQYLHDGKIFTAKAKKEIILAAGAINSAKILLHSGIGPKEECEKHEIPLVADLKVGHNFNIRPSFIGLDFIDKTDHIDEHEAMLQYLKYGKGPLTSPGVDALVFLKTNHSKDHANYPDVELQFVSKPCPKFEDYQWMGLSEEHYDSIWKPVHDKKLLKAIVTLNHPESKGVLKLHSSNPLEDPLIEPHFLQDEDEIDYHTMLAGIQAAIDISHTKAFEKLGLTINPHPIHGCEKTKFGSDSYWECAIKYLVVPTEDVSGTAKMGPLTDKTAVVDNKLKVHGVHKLRVADASVIPVPMTGNLMAPSILIGEKAAKLIIEDWEEH